jgi:two-component system, cell cycle response regulator CpdR
VPPSTVGCVIRQRRLRDRSAHPNDRARSLTKLAGGAHVISGNRHPSRVLVVDDDPACLASVADALRDIGCDVVESATYFDALDAIDRPTDSAFDLLVTDIILDCGNGYALARIARTHHPGLKTIYMTADLQMAADEAVGPLLRKPFEADALIVAVGAVLRREG